MAARLTEKKKQKIIADYLDNQSYSATAKINGVTHQTVSRIIRESPDFAAKLQQKKADDAADILAYMDSKRDIVCEIIDTGLRVLPEKIENARTASEVTTAMGTLLDKWLGAANSGRALQAEDDELTQSLEEIGRALKSDDQS